MFFSKKLLAHFNGKYQYDLTKFHVAQIDERFIMYE